eukprot:10946203-Heterocapsa_arctica.AAC.1
MAVMGRAPEGPPESKSTNTCFFIMNCRRTSPTTSENPTPAGRSSKPRAKPRNDANVFSQDPSPSLRSRSGTV